jgi:hypothetical protein
MSDSTVILALDGDVTLEAFSEAVSHFTSLLLQLTQEVAADAEIEWALEDLNYGSAMIAAAGRAEVNEPVLRVVSAFENVGQALQHHDPIPFSQHVISEAQALTRLIRHDITSLRLGTARKEAIVYAVFDAQKIAMSQPMVSFGAVKGRVQSISNRGKLRFTLYDSVFDKPITCFITEEQRHILTNIWDRLIFVTGRVTRQPDSGQPVSVREITSIDFIPTVEAGSYRRTRGILTQNGTPEPAEISIRRLRDAEG